MVYDGAEKIWWTTRRGFWSIKTTHIYRSQARYCWSPQRNTLKSRYHIFVQIIMGQIQFYPHSWWWKAVLSCRRSKTQHGTCRSECREETCRISSGRWRWCGSPGCTARSCPCRSTGPPASIARRSLYRSLGYRWKCSATTSLWQTPGSWGPSRAPWSCRVWGRRRRKGTCWAFAPATRRWSRWRRWCCSPCRWSATPRRCRWTRLSRLSVLWTQRLKDMKQGEGLPVYGSSNFE